MYISSFHIDGFGIFHDTGADNLSPGMAIFLGPNESGKSTCLEFLRTMLFGYPAKKGSRLVSEPVNGGRPGGSLVLKVPGGKNEEIHLFRVGGKGEGALSLFTASGHGIAREELERLFAGITRDVYRSVYGFSLTELENFACLNAEAVRSALYSASFGPGINPPGEVLQALCCARNVIFTPGSKKSSLHKMLEELEGINRRLAELIEKTEAFDAKTMQLADAAQSLAQTREKRKCLEEERRKLERGQNAWNHFKKLRFLRMSLESMPVRASGNFPADGAGRLRDLQKDQMLLQRQIAEYGEKMAAIGEQKQALVINLPLAEALPGLKRLAERKSGYRQALMQIPGEEDAIRRDTNELADALARLGPDWDCQRIHNTNRSLFARENLEKQARDMAAATSAHQACIDALAKANREVESIGREAAATRKTLQSLPEPAAILNGAERDDLRQNMARLEECIRSCPLREQSLENARMEFVRAFDKLHFQESSVSEELSSVLEQDGKNSSASEGECVLLDNLLSRQDEALALAAQLGERIKACEKLGETLSLAQEEAENTHKKIEDLRNRQRQEAGPGRDALDASAQALRNLRALSASIATEKERLRELDGRINAQKMPLASKSIPLLVFGGLLFLAGAAILLCHWVFGLTEYSFTPSLTIPVNSLNGYLVLACGIAFIAGGLPRSGPEARHFADEMANLQNRRETCALHLAELGEQARSICEQAGFADSDPITLDATEMLLEREREQCYQEEQTAREMDDLQRQWERQREKISNLAQEQQRKEQEAQQGRRQWHALMQTLHLATIPSPESAESFFARAENARFAYNAVAACAKEVKRSSQEKDELERRISSLPPVAEILRESGLRLAEAVVKLLESCREADSFRDQRIRAGADLQNQEGALARAEAAQQEAAAALNVAAARLEKSRMEWNSGIAVLGLGEDLNPETVREAFKCMEHCLQLESGLEGRRASVARSRQQLEALEKPLLEYMQELGEESARDEHGSPDWLLTLDGLLARAEAMDASIKSLSVLDRQLEREMDEMRGLQAQATVTGEQIKALLREGGAGSEEEFMRLAAAWEEENELQKGCREMRDVLKITAGSEDLETFLAGLEKLADGEIEARLAEITQNLEQLVQQEDLLAQHQAVLDAEVAGIANSGELAGLRQKKALLIEKMEKAAHAWSVNALAGAIISEARNVFEQERQPEIIGRASEIFASITNGRWRGLSVSLENSTLLALPVTGEPLPPECLSRGAQEQIYLSLRLAYIREHARNAQTLPIIMDDILVNFDPERARRTARAFARLVDDEQQLFYFTCQPDTAKMLADASPGAACYIVENGQISEHRL